MTRTSARFPGSALHPISPNQTWKHSLPSQTVSTSKVLPGWLQRPAIHVLAAMTTGRSCAPTAKTGRFEYLWTPLSMTEPLSSSSAAGPCGPQSAHLQAATNFSIPMIRTSTSKTIWPTRNMSASWMLTMALWLTTAGSSSKQRSTSARSSTPSNTQTQRTTLKSGSASRRKTGATQTSPACTRMWCHRSNTSNQWLSPLTVNTSSM